MLRVKLHQRSRLPARAVAAALLALCGCATPLSEAECDALLAHYTERLLQSDRKDLNELERRDLEAKSRILAHQDPAFARCSSQVSRSAYECAMKAGSADEIERCLL